MPHPSIRGNLSCLRSPGNQPNNQPNLMAENMFLLGEGNEVAPEVKVLQSIRRITRHYYEFKCNVAT